MGDACNDPQAAKKYHQIIQPVDFFPECLLPDRHIAERLRIDPTLGRGKRGNIGRITIGTFGVREVARDNDAEEGASKELGFRGRSIVQQWRCPEIMSDKIYYVNFYPHLDTTPTVVT